MGHETGNAVQGRVGNVLDGYANVPFPDEYFLVVAGGNHFAADKTNGIDGTEVVVVFLGDFGGGGVVREDLFVVAAHDKVFVVVAGVVLQDVGESAVEKGLEDAARLRVPEANGAVKGGGEELGAILVELDIPDGGRVSRVCAHQCVGDEGPYLAGSVEIGREYQMARNWKETNPMHALVRTSFKAAYHFLGQKATMITLSTICTNGSGSSGGSNP